MHTHNHMPAAHADLLKHLCLECCTSGKKNAFGIRVIVGLHLPNEENGTTTPAIIDTKQIKPPITWCPPSCHGDLFADPQWNHPCASRYFGLKWYHGASCYRAVQHGACIVVTCTTMRPVREAGLTVRTWVNATKPGDTVMLYAKRTKIIAQLVVHFNTCAWSNEFFGFQIS